MAKITQLVSQPFLVDDDFVPVVDVSDGTMGPSGSNKKMTAKNLADSVSSLFTNGILSGSKITVGSITSDKIATGAITSINIATSAIITNKIAASAITTDKIAAGAITSITIAASAITAFNIAAGAITSDKIAASAITSINIATSAITSDKIAAGAITADKIAVNAITTNSLSAGAITTDKIAAGAITSITIAASAITADKIATGAITADKIAAGAITADKIAVNAITTNSLSAGTITSDKIAAGAITSITIAASAITADKIAANSITSNKIVAGAITTNTLQASAITADKIAAGAIASNSMLASNIIAANNLVTDFILTKNIQSDNFNGQITNNLSNTNSITSRTINVGTSGYYLDSQSGTIIASKFIARDGIIAGNYIKYNNTGAFEVDALGNLGVKVDQDTLAISNGSLVIKQVPSTSIVIATKDINYISGLNTTAYTSMTCTNPGQGGSFITSPANIWCVYDALSSVGSALNITEINLYNVSFTINYANVQNLAAATGVYLFMLARWSDSPTALLNSSVMNDGIGVFFSLINPSLPAGSVTYTIPKIGVTPTTVSTNRYLIIAPDFRLTGPNMTGTVGISAAGTINTSLIIKATGQITSPNNAFSTLVKPAGSRIRLGFEP